MAGVVSGEAAALKRQLEAAGNNEGATRARTDGTSGERARQARAGRGAAPRTWGDVGRAEALARRDFSENSNTRHLEPVACNRSLKDRSSCIARDIPRAVTCACGATCGFRPEIIVIVIILT